MSSYQTSKREAAHEDSAWSVLWTAGDKIVSGSIDETVKVQSLPPRPVFSRKAFAPPAASSPLSSLLSLLLILAAKENCELWRLYGRMYAGM
jgi:hypothetical protein